LPEKAEGFTMRSSAVLRCKPRRSTYFYIRFAVRFLRALHLNIFEQPQTGGRQSQRTNYLPDINYFIDLA
jgi:hypothetical protein